jgi:hypothetical protein
MKRRSILILCLADKDVYIIWRAIFLTYIYIVKSCINVWTTLVGSVPLYGDNLAAPLLNGKFNR